MCVTEQCRLLRQILWRYVSVWLYKLFGWCDWIPWKRDPATTRSREIGKGKCEENEDDKEACETAKQRGIANTRKRNVAAFGEIHQKPIIVVHIAFYAMARAKFKLSRNCVIRPFHRTESFASPLTTTTAFALFQRLLAQMASDGWSALPFTPLIRWFGDMLKLIWRVASTCCHIQVLRDNNFDVSAAAFAIDGHRC